MSYVVEQKIKGRIYLYRVDSYWDKEKKQSRQKRTYLGPKTPIESKRTSKKQEILYKKYGNVFFLRTLSHQLGLEKILEDIFPHDYKEILALAFFHICDDNAMYLFPHWLHEQCDVDSRSLHSTDISSLCEKLGSSQESIARFFEKWIHGRNPTAEIYYDTTSISSYSSTIDFIEWGYNRDKEHLPQLNLGMACQKDGTPLFYQIYPGSIPDVSTLKNHLILLEHFHLTHITLVLDRGFCSQANIGELQKLHHRMKFIQPMTFSMKKVIRALQANRKKLQRIETAFKYDEEVLHHVKDMVNIGGVDYHAHIYYNERVETDVRHHFLAKLLTYQEILATKTCETMKEYLEMKNVTLPETYRAYFTRNRQTGSIELNVRNIKKHVFKAGYFILLSNSQDLDRTRILDHYRHRDIIEKLFDCKKNELDGRRLRVHSQYNSDGRIFIKFIALIIYSHIACVMRKKKLFNLYSVKEIMAELSKIRCSQFSGEKVVSEISKTQRKILSAFNITPEMINEHRY
ncbi:MAG: IS1634 family transposase [bacterium]|nr:IS1634 family transposase [bacterium]